MNNVSPSRFSPLPHQWRPGLGAELPAWRPSAVQMPVETAALGQAMIKAPSLGQVSSMAAAAGTSLVGFGLAIWGPKDSPTWRWIGGLAGSIGVLRLLHDISNL